MRTNQQFKYLGDNLSKVLTVHCSTSGLHDSETGLSPRITGIAVHNIEHDVTHNFAYYLIAEKKGISKEDITNHYDDIELQMLEEFFSFAEENSDKLWVYWNMSSIIFGFQLLEHRYEVLARKKPYIIPDEKKYNLSIPFGTHVACLITDRQVFLWCADLASSRVRFLRELTSEDRFSKTGANARLTK